MILSSQDELTKPKRCLIIGGGISGLIAATVLQRAGINVTILDKGRGIGGRLATRRISHPSYGEGTFDYGAQFFTVSNSIFQLWIDEWLQSGVVKEWSRQLSEVGKPCYQGVESNRSIAQYLAKDLDIHTQTRAIKLIWEYPHWLVQTEDGVCFQGDVLIITSPIPQSLALFDCSEIVLPSELRHRLEQVNYQRCIAVLALLERPSIIPDPGGVWLNDPSLAWMACNRRKGISQGNAVTLHATPEFSQTYWEIDNPIVAAKMFDIASPWLGSTVVDYQVHRWRYSQPNTFFGEFYLTLREPGLLVMAGDAFSSTRSEESSLNLERAVLSGFEAANYLLGYTEEVIWN
jgi:renalase